VIGKGVEQMPGILIFSENGVVAGQLVTAGLGLKASMIQPLYAAVIGEGEAVRIAGLGVDKVFVLKGAGGEAARYAEAIAGLASAEQTEVILVGGTLRGKDVAARVAAHLQAGLVTEAQTVLFAEGQLQTTRLIYGGLALATEATSLPAVATIAPQLFDESVSVGHPSEIVPVAVTDSDSRVTIREVNPVIREGVEITAARRIVCVGRGLGKQEDLKLVEALADAVGAEIGCTRGIAEDCRWLPVDRYIGISGRKVKPDFYISLGVSGQIQHVAGIRDAGIIVAVDTNEKAPIFSVADYGIVGDLYEVAPLLTAALKKA